MKKISAFTEKLKGYMMPFAMIIGFVFHQQVSELSFLIPYLIFVMLLLTYVKLSWRGMVFTKMHLWLLVFQLVASVLVYWVISPFSQVLAQGTTEQASAIEELSAEINEIYTAIVNNAEYAQNAGNKALESAKEVEKGNMQMKDMLSAMDEISNSSREIGKIIKVISCYQK